MSHEPFPEPTRRSVHAALRRLGFVQREPDMDLVEEPLTDDASAELGALGEGEHVNRVTPSFVLMVEARTDPMSVALSRYDNLHPDAAPPDYSPTKTVEGWVTTFVDPELFRDLSRLAWATHRGEHEALGVCTATGAYPLVMESRHAFLHLAPRVERSGDAPTWRSEP